MAEYEPDDVVVQRVDEFAVYVNVDEKVVIFQSGLDEAFVCVPKTHVAAIAKRMLRLASE